MHPCVQGNVLLCCTTIEYVQSKRDALFIVARMKALVRQFWSFTQIGFKVFVLVINIMQEFPSYISCRHVDIVIETVKTEGWKIKAPSIQQIVSNIFEKVY